MSIAIALATSKPQSQAALGADNAAPAAAGATFSEMLRSSGASEAGTGAALPPSRGVEPAIGPRQARNRGALPAPEVHGAGAAVAPLQIAAARRHAPADGALASDDAANASLDSGATHARAATASAPPDAAQPERAPLMAAAPRRSTVQPAGHAGRNRTANPGLAPRIAASPGHPADNRHAALAVDARRDAKASNLVSLPPVAPVDEHDSGTAPAQGPNAGAAIDPSLVLAGAGQALVATAAMPQRLVVADAAPADPGHASGPVARAQARSRSLAAAGHAQDKPSAAAPRDDRAAASAATAATDAEHASAPVAAAQVMSPPGAGAGRATEAPTSASRADAAEDSAAPAAAQMVAAMIAMPMRSAGDGDPNAETGRTEGPTVRRLEADRPIAAGNALRAKSTGDAQRGPEAAASTSITAATDPPPRTIAIDAPAQQTSAIGVASRAVRERSAFDPGADGVQTLSSPVAIVASAAGTTPTAAGPHAEPPAVREAHIAAAVGDPGFAPAVGATLAMLTRDGVQQARLQLHPAEMGPITVQIALDGQSARVDFHAAVAETRQALESALPALASALRESGLTLTGGGVFQQTPGRQGGDPRAGDPGGMVLDRTVDEMPAASQVSVARRGLVDLVA